MESDKENTESICNEASNIYTGIEDFDLGREIEKLTLENKLLEDHIGSLQGDIEKLSSALLKLKSIQENLTKNISSLYLTAKNEIDRKDRIIADLRCQLDNITFRRMGIRQQKRKPEEALEANNKKPKYQETDTCSGSNNKKSSRQQTNNQDVILINDDSSSSSSSKNLVERNVLTSDQQNRKDNGIKEHLKKPEESNCNNDKNFKEYRHRSKSIDRRQQTVDNSTYKNRSKSRDRRKQNYDISPHYGRQEENDEHENSDNCRYRRPDYGYNDDERFDERTRYRRNRKTIVNRPPNSRKYEN